MSVIKNIPFTVYLQNTSVIVRAISHRFFRRLICVDMQITIADDYASIGKSFIRFFADRITKLVHHDGRINKIIVLPHLANRRSLEKFMSFESRSRTIFTTRNDKNRRFFHRQHIRPQNGQHRTVSGLVSPAAETCVQISRITFRQHARVELRLVSFFFSETGSVLIVHITVKRKVSRGRIADRNRNDAYFIQHIVQIISAVRPYRNVRRIQAHFSLFVERVRIPRINHALIPPVPQIIHRSRPADIVAHAENITVIIIMGTVYIDPVSEHIRLAVRNILPGRQIGVHSLSVLCASFHVTSISCFVHFYLRSEAFYAEDALRLTEFVTLRHKFVFFL